MKNFEEKELTVQEQVKQLMAQRESNKIELGASLMEKRVHEGMEILDKETRMPIVDESTGETRRYPNKYYITLAFTGATLELEVDELKYNDLEVTKRYFCAGYLTLVKVFGKEQVLPKFSSFVEL
jgi:hypothetical protein